jgi:type I restriction enzyme S subunit
MSGWKTCTLSDLGEIVGGATPSTKVDNYYGGDISWLTPKDLSNHKGRYIARGERNITIDGLNSCSTRLMPRHTVLFTSRAPIGYVAIAEKEVCTNQGFKSIVPNSKTDYLFLYYLMVFKKRYIENMGTGTTFKEISGGAMKQIPVFVPSNIKEQKAISSILGALDDKIENNEKINNHLEQVARAFFKSWFIDFEPFDGEMPIDWQVGNLTDIASYLNGLTMQRFRPMEGENGLPVLKIKELRQGICDSSSDLCSPSINPDYIVRDGDVIFSWSGSLLVDFWCGGDCGLNQHLFKVASQKYDKWFYYSWTHHHLERFIALAADKATTMGHIKRSDLENAKVLIPSERDYQEVGKLLTPVYEHLICNRIENRKLALLRDTLLPLLMSGELSVTELSKTK